MDGACGWKLQTGHPIALGADVVAKSHTGSSQRFMFRNLLTETPPHLQSWVSTRADANSMGVGGGSRASDPTAGGGEGRRATGITSADDPLACQQIEILCDHSYLCPGPWGWQLVALVDLFGFLPCGQ